MQDGYQEIVVLATSPLLAQLPPVYHMQQSCGQSCYSAACMWGSLFLSGIRPAADDKHVYDDVLLVEIDSIRSRLHSCTAAIALWCT